MSNTRITKKERGLLKGAFRRVFSRSELRLKVLNTARIEHKDSKRPRVTKWIRCALCKLPTAAYTAAVDHILPLVPVDTAFEDMSMDTVIDRLWCEENNLQVLCETCHDIKTKQESQQRKAARKARKSSK